MAKKKKPVVEESESESEQESSAPSETESGSEEEDDSASGSYDDDETASSASGSEEGSSDPESGSDEDSGSESGSDESVSICIYPRILLHWRLACYFFLRFRCREDFAARFRLAPKPSPTLTFPSRTCVQCSGVWEA